MNMSQAHDSSDVYDPDDVVPRNSPLLQPTCLRFQPSPSPPPVFPRHTVSLPSSSGKGLNRRMRVQASQGDAVLVSLLDGGRRPEIAEQAGKEPLASASDSDDDEVVSSEADSPPGSARSRLGEATDQEQEIRERNPDAIEGVGEGRGNALSASTRQGGDTGVLEKTSHLQDLAASALVFAVPESRQQQEPANAGPTPPFTEHDVVFRERTSSGPIPPAIATRRDVPYPHDQPTPSTTTVPSPYTPQSMNLLYSPRDSMQTILAPPKMSPTNGLTPSSLGEGLPPIQMTSPRSDTAGTTPAPSLPSIKDQFGDLKTLEQQHSPAYSTHSPPGNMQRLPSMHASHTSPPISPNESFHSKLPSPGQLPLAQSSGYHAYYSNGMPSRPLEYGSSSAATPGSDHSGAPEGQSGDANRMNLMGGNGHPGGQYVCTFPDCNAPPFQTQYLLNSHANVHSSARPHYCPVKGCPRSEGGKGFKRKNEMIRHGLVHESPGYVCPFCPDREHKYPRPDNLQRHVRVHHLDKDKDDPLLRDVLAQRPDGPNRGRRRRAVNP